MSAKVDLLLANAESLLDQLSSIPASEFERKHRKDLTRIRVKLRQIAGKTPARVKGARGRPEMKETLETGKRAYELRQWPHGRSWADIAEITGVISSGSKPESMIEDRAKRYAQKNNLPWPVGPAAPGVKRRG